MRNMRMREEGVRAKRRWREQRWREQRWREQRWREQRWRLQRWRLQRWRLQRWRLWKATATSAKCEPCSPCPDEPPSNTLPPPSQVLSHVLDSNSTATPPPNLPLPSPTLLLPTNLHNLKQQTYSILSSTAHLYPPPPPCTAQSSNPDTAAPPGAGADAATTSYTSPPIFTNSLATPSTAAPPPADPLTSAVSLTSPPTTTLHPPIKPPPPPFPSTTSHLPSRLLPLLTHGGWSSRSLRSATPASLLYTGAAGFATMRDGEVVRGAVGGELGTVVGGGGRGAVRRVEEAKMEIVFLG